MPSANLTCALFVSVAVTYSSAGGISVVSWTRKRKGTISDQGKNLSRHEICQVFKIFTPRIILGKWPGLNICPTEYGYLLVARADTDKIRSIRPHENAHGLVFRRLPLGAAWPRLAQFSVRVQSVFG